MRRNLAPGCISSDVKLCQRKPLFPIFFGDPFFWDPLFSFFCFFLSPAKVGSLEMQPGAKLQAYLGVSILQPYASTQRFRLRILRRTRSNEYKPFGKPPLKRESGVTARNWSLAASLARLGQGRPECGWTAPGHGSPTKEARLLAKLPDGAQRKVLIIHLVGGPDVLHGRVLAALLGPKSVFSSTQPVPRVLVCVGVCWCVNCAWTRNAC